MLVRVHATSVAMGDCELRGLKLPFGWKLLLRIGLGIRAPRKKILGQELARRNRIDRQRCNAVQEGRQILSSHA